MEEQEEKCKKSRFVVISWKCEDFVILYELIIFLTFMLMRFMKKGPNSPKFKNFLQLRIQFKLNQVLDWFSKEINFPSTVESTKDIIRFFHRRHILRKIGRDSWIGRKKIKFNLWSSSVSYRHRCTVYTLFFLYFLGKFSVYVFYVPFFLLLYSTLKQH